MAEVLFEFQSVFSSPDGAAYRARACGAPSEHGLWHGWIEFVPIGGGKVLRSPRETTQPNRTDTVYWAGGLTHIYLEGAFDRALNPLIVSAPPPLETPAYNGPAPAYEVGAPVVPKPAAILDPFSVYEKGESLLRRQLGALSAWQLVNIIQAYGLSAESAETLNRLTPTTLIELIALGVRQRTIT
jgi:hypothetical protein